jgi:glycerol-3-phosphate dehydrogenase (NAD(P)+)
MNVTVIGGGAFGTAIACSLAQTASTVTVLVRNPEQADSINNLRRNSQYLPDHKLPKKVRASTDPACVSESSAVFLATPAHSLEATCEKLRPHLSPQTTMVNLAKGLHAEYFTLDKALAAYLPGQGIATLKGPNFARPLLHGAPSGMTLAASLPEHAEAIKPLFKNSTVTLEEWSDLAAVEFISAAKNVLAIIMGICDATDDNPNTRFMVVQRILKEAHLLLETFSFHPGVLFTYAGCGDLLMTALNDSSRNRTLGLLIGRGFEFASSASGPVLEGRRTIGLINKRLQGSAQNQQAGTHASRHQLLLDLEQVFLQNLSPQAFFKKITLLPNRSRSRA